MPTPTPEQAVDALVARFEYDHAQLFHGSGEPVLPEREHHRRVSELIAGFDRDLEPIGQQARAQLQAAEEGLEALSAPPLDAVYRLSPADLARATALLPWVQQEVGQPLPALSQTVRAILQGEDRAAAAVWSRELARRLDGTELQNDRDQLRALLDSLNVRLAPDAGDVAEKRRNLEYARVMSRDLVRLCNSAADRVHGSQARALVDTRRRAAQPA